MTIPSAFITKGVGDKLSSGDVNTLNANVQMGIDRRAGQTDTLASVVSCSGAGRIVPQVSIGPDTAASLTVGVNSNVLCTTLTAPRSYTLSATGAIAGDAIYVNNPGAQPLLVIDGPSTGALIYLGTSAPLCESTWCNFLFNGTNWVVDSSSRRLAVGATIFTASGNWTAPQGCTLALLDGWGGGAGGGGGIAGNTASAASAPGGGAGGAARRRSMVVAVTPGTVYAVTIGGGGSGGAIGADGSNGADTTFGALATFLGAESGSSGALVYSVAAYAAGGGPSRLVPAYGRGVVSSPTSPFGVLRGLDGAGGPGMNRIQSTANAVDGNGSLDGFAGGAGAATGVTNGIALGGGSGGGGGGGPAGAGGAGGTGGAGGNTGSSAPGVAGSTAAANSGGGGGGGGSSGQCTGAGSPGVGAAGGSGGSGQLTVVPLR